MVAQRGIGAAHVASQIGISRQTIYAIEAGTYVPNNTVSLKLSKTLDTTFRSIRKMEYQKIVDHEPIFHKPNGITPRHG
jgi:DNA-binding XRE family transcriptional regulator